MLPKMDEAKKEISFQLLCNACLCVGRTLYQVTDEKLKQYYHGALSEISLCGMPIMLPSICWDCKALLRKGFEFREQVKDSYRILLAYTSENLHECLLTDVSRPPRLKIRKNDSVNIEPDYTYDVVTLLDENNSHAGSEGIDKKDTKYVPNNKPSKVHVPKTSPPYTEIVLGYQGTQEVFVKEELKLEDMDSDRDGDYSDGPLEDDAKSIQFDNLAEIDTELKSIISDGSVNKKMEDVKLIQLDSLAEIDSGIKSIIGEVGVNKKSKAKLHMKGTNTARDRTKRKMSKARSKKKTKRPTEEIIMDVPGILTVDLSYEEMTAEREMEHTKDHYVNAEYKCETCIIGFHYQKSYKTHLTNKHSPDIGDYTCPVCKTVLSTVDAFSTHYKRHMRRYQCSICQKRTMDMKVMQQHYYSSHDISLKKYKCLDCGQISNSVDSHRYHTDTHKARLACPDCDKTFRHRGGLLNHRLAVHESRNMFPCTQCDKEFRWKNSLKRHLDAHEAKKKSTLEAAFCALCSVSFASLGSYQRHMNNSLKHVTKDEFRFICDLCQRRFSDKTKLRDHIEEKHLHRTYQCNICLKISKNRVNLDQHIRNVHKGRPNNKICHHCGKGFPTKVQLESHIRTHTGERPFICEYCPTTFSQQSNLYKHNRQVHLNMKTKRYPMAKKRKDERPPDMMLPPEIAVEYPVDIEFSM